MIPTRRIENSHFHPVQNTIPCAPAAQRAASLMQGKSVAASELFDFFPPLSYLLRAFCDAGRVGNVLREREMRRVSCFCGKVGTIQCNNNWFWLLMWELLDERAQRDREPVCRRNMPTQARDVARSQDF
jgi:hypothetical protein